MFSPVNKQKVEEPHGIAKKLNFNNIISQSNSSASDECFSNSEYSFIIDRIKSAAERDRVRNSDLHVSKTVKSPNAYEPITKPSTFVYTPVRKLKRDKHKSSWTEL